MINGTTSFKVLDRTNKSQPYDRVLAILLITNKNIDRNSKYIGLDRVAP
jgi:hypothetical protein